MAKANSVTTVTRYDVAKLANVSVATVSYVVNNGPRQVSEETRARVLDAIDRLAYRPSDVARSLKTNKTLTVGLIVSDILNPFHSGVARGVEQVARAAGYTVLLCNSDENVEQELNHLHMMESKRVDGIILVPTGGNVDYLNKMIKKGWNVVQIDRRIPGIMADSVLMDNEQGAFDAVMHLIERGHRRIALMNIPGGLTPGLERRRGYEKALYSAGIPMDPDLVCESDFKSESGSNLAHHLFSLESPPDAIFVANNRLALDVVRLLRERCLNMPQDVALCVFDDVDYYAVWNPTITAVTYSIPDLSRKAFQLLLQRMQGEWDSSRHRHERIPCTLMIRESSTLVRSRD